jgi:hypothetical protein
VVDIDSPEGKELDWALDTFGRSPIVVRTGSGKHHVWYRHGGERRRIRPIPGHEIDLLGEGGYSVAPPSIRPGGGKYEFLAGSLADVAKLPPIRPEALQELIAEPVAVLQEPDALDAPGHAGVSRGARNASLFNIARSLAGDALSLEALLSQLRAANAKMNNPPLPDAEVDRMAGSVWRYKDEGRLFRPGAQHIVLPVAAIEPLIAAGEVDAVTLLLRLQKAHAGQRSTFAASPKAMERARLIGSWGHCRYREGLGALCRFGLLERTSMGGRSGRDPAQYRFSSPSSVQSGGVLD